MSDDQNHRRCWRGLETKVNTYSQFCKVNTNKVNTHSQYDKQSGASSENYKYVQHDLHISLLDKCIKN